MKKDLVLGADLSWTSQLEGLGYRWVDDRGQVTDPLRLCRELGVNAVRLRVFVDPPEGGYWEKPEREVKGHAIPGGMTMLGFCGKTDILAMARRVKALGMGLMLDLHYSDHFADPVYQDKPATWGGKTLEELVECVSWHTEEVVKLFLGSGIVPDQVQVGNELNRGLLWPEGSFTDAPRAMVRLLNAGYDAVKKHSPETAVVTHLSMGHVLEQVKGFFDVFFSLGGKTDMIGLSYYPAWFEDTHHPKEFLEMLTCVERLYHKPIILSEIGGRCDDPGGSYSLLADTLKVIEAVPNDHGVGMYYWEPEAPPEVLPDHYPLGAAELAGEKTIRYTKALGAFYDHLNK